ncbi:MAG TPA: hypothetical protein VEL11_00515 [Candidatus Bathyarchaeia archaeon]|nr:hypothetical protein [Candidatus Bathyarchaeia archaeon]
MNQTTLVIVVALAASALIMGTAGMLQPAAAQIQSSQEIKANNNNCNFKGSSCTGNYNQAANTIVYVKK